MTIKEQVDRIQDKLWKQEVSVDRYFLKYTVFGMTEGVDLVIMENNFTIEMNIWDSENNQLVWNEELDEYEDFETLLIRCIKEAINSLGTLKEILK